MSVKIAVLAPMPNAKGLRKHRFCTRRRTAIAYPDDCFEQAHFTLASDERKGGFVRNCRKCFARKHGFPTRHSVRKASNGGIESLERLDEG